MISRRFPVLCVTASITFACLAAPGTSSADGSFAIGARAGYALALGSAYQGPSATTGEQEDKSQSDTVGSGPGLMIDAMYKVTPSLGVGVFLGYAMTSPKKPDGADSVSATALTYGVQAQYALTPGQPTPWFGAGLGLEAVTSKTKFQGGGDADGGVSGIAFILQGGYDLKALDGKLSWGPFASLSIGQYSKYKAQAATGGSEDKDIDNKTVHETLLIGLRGLYDL
jgi:hypothetical protein